MRLKAIVSLLWWAGCISAIAIPLTLAVRAFEGRPAKFHWQLADNAQPENFPFGDEYMQRALANTAAHYRQAPSSLKQLAANISQLPFVKQAQVTKTAGGNIHLAIGLFTPFALLNGNLYVNTDGEIKRIHTNTYYNPQLVLYLPPDQLQQFLPAILVLATTVAQEGLGLASIQITRSGIWTVSLLNGWVMLFGPEPDFPHFFDQLRQALPEILRRGVPLRFDFRYETAIAVTYES